MFFIFYNFFLFQYVVKVIK